MNFHGGYHGDAALIDFSVNIPPTVYDEAYQKLLIDHIGDLIKYPALSGETTIESMSKVLGYDMQQLILGNGATELIYLYARTVTIKNALILEPTFTEYRRALMTHGIPVKSYPIDLEAPEKINIAELADCIIDNDIDLLVLCNPNNPTGHLYAPEDIEAILKLVGRRDFKLFIDESFIDFVDEAYQRKNAAKMKALLCDYPIFLLRSMTKTYAVPGLRIGYGIGHPSIITSLYRYKEPWSLNTFALLSIPYFLEQSKQKENVNAWCKTESQFVAEGLAAYESAGKIRFYRGCANYHLIEVKSVDGNSFFQRMLEAGCFLRTCNDFKGLGNGYFRIALRTRSENKKMLDAMAIALEA
ncbi:MAG: threonine-phosphate decarboxylase [Clostridiales bacterium]|nr:threonine-phosphate decarboxylase [Clostridiales bacterium]